MANIREDFNSKLISIMRTKKPNSSFLTKERYDDLLKKVSNSKNKTSGKKPEDYQRLKRYDIMKVGNVEKLIFPKSKDGSSVRFYVYFEELFNIIHETHLSLGHGGRNKMIKELQKRYKNITTEEVMIYLNLCESCQKKSKGPNKGLTVRPLVFQEMLNSRCQVDIIDRQFQPDSEFKFILVYQDYITKFIQLRALKTKRTKEVANHLINIFTVFGAPSVLQSDNGREFSSKIVEEACSMWPDLKIVHGTPIPSQTQGSRERVNQDVENMLRCWLESNHTSKWSEGLRFVQLMKNRTFHEGLKCTPYEAMFGTPVKLGLKTSSFPNNSIEHLRTEEELQALIEAVNNAFETKNDISNADTEKNKSQNNSLPGMEFRLKRDFQFKKEQEEDEDTEADETDVDDNPSQNNSLSGMEFEPKREIEAEDSLQTDIVSSQKQTRKRRGSVKEDSGHHGKKTSKTSNFKLSSGERDETVQSRASNFDGTSDPRSLLEVILEV